MAISGKADVVRAAEVAREAYKEWGGLTVKKRATVLIKLHHLIEQNYDRIADIIVLEHGKNKVCWVVVLMTYMIIFNCCVDKGPSNKYSLYLSLCVCVCVCMCMSTR